MKDQLPTFNQQTLLDIHSATSLPGSADGPMPCSLQDGQPTDLFGREAVLASHSRSPAKAKVRVTCATSGPSLPGSSASVALQSFTESRLRQLLATGGSMEYLQTWREKATPAGRQFLAHIASARRTSDSGCTGWPTPQTMDTLPPMDYEKRLNHPSRPGRNTSGNLREVVTLSGWPTASSRDSKGGYEGGRIRDGKISTDTLDVAAQLTGTTPTGTTAATENPGAYRLNPKFSLWLMGFPAEWASSGARAMQSCRNAPRRSS